MSAVLFVAPVKGPAKVVGQPQPIWVALTPPLRVWWHWTEEGFSAWSTDVWIIVGWVLTGLCLIPLFPLALLGQLCRYLRKELVP